MLLVISLLFTFHRGDPTPTRQASDFGGLVTLELSHRLRPRSRLASGPPGQRQLSYMLVKIIFLLSYKEVLQQMHHFIGLKEREMSVGE